jgi:hypothetical protein
MNIQNKFSVKNLLISNYQPNQGTKIKLSNKPSHLSHFEINGKTDIIYYSNIQAILFQIEYGLGFPKKCLEYEIKSNIPIKLFFFNENKETGIKIVNDIKNELKKWLKMDEKIIDPICIPTAIGFLFVFHKYYFISIKAMTSFITNATSENLNITNIKHIPPLGMKQLDGNEFYNVIQNKKYVKELHLHFISNNCNEIDVNYFRCFFLQ